MTDFDANSYSEAELHAEFDRLFPHGFAGPDVLQELAPGGWENSPLLAVCHPSLEQTYEETIRIHRNMVALRRPDDERPVPPEPTLDEIAGDFQEQPIEVEPEVRELVGQCLWDIFSDSHEVVATEDDRVLNLGSFRSSGGFLAGVLNRQTGADDYDYMNFYMGTIWVAQRADLTPVYRMIFRRLREHRLDWIYHSPRLYAIDLRPLKEALDQKDEPDWLNYSPSEALAREEEQKEHDQNLAELRESLDEGYREAIEEALNAPLPATVRAYEAVYGHLPRGWPPVALDRCDHDSIACLDGTAAKELGRFPEDGAHDGTSGGSPAEPSSTPATPDRRSADGGVWRPATNSQLEIRKSHYRPVPKSWCSPCILKIVSPPAPAQ